MIYFCHPMATYGTAGAALALARIRTLFPGRRIRDPEKIDWGALETRYGREGAYAAAMRGCVVVVVLELAGACARGQGLEIELGLRKGLRVLCLREKALYSVRGVRRLPGSDWSRWCELVTVPASRSGPLAPPQLAEGGGGS